MKKYAYARGTQISSMTDVFTDIASLSGKKNADIPPGLLPLFVVGDRDLTCRRSRSDINFPSRSRNYFSIKLVRDGWIPGSFWSVRWAVLSSVHLLLAARKDGLPYSTSTLVP